MGHTSRGGDDRPGLVEREEKGVHRKGDFCEFTVPINIEMITYLYKNVNLYSILTIKIIV